jgi:hypothetical protein
VKDGRVLAAAEEERFTHVKHGKRPVPFSTWELPFHAIHYCLKEREVVEGIRAMMRAPSQSLAGRLRLAELAALLKLRIFSCRTRSSAGSRAASSSGRVP